MDRPQASARPHAKPFRGNLIDLELYRTLTRTFGLGADEIRRIDIDLAIEYGLIDKPRDR